jgi:hypothetical protein
MPMEDKMARLFRKLASPCQFIPVNGDAPFERLVSTGHNRRELQQVNEYIADPVLLASFLKSEGTPLAGDVFDLNGHSHQLTQMYSTDDYTVDWVYI